MSFLRARSTRWIHPFTGAQRLSDRAKADLINTKTYSFSIAIIVFSFHLDCNRLQLIIRSFVEQNQRSRQVLLLSVDHVCLQSVQLFVVAQEYVSILVEYSVAINEQCESKAPVRMVSSQKYHVSAIISVT